MAGSRNHLKVVGGTNHHPDDEKQEDLTEEEKRFLVNLHGIHESHQKLRPRFAINRQGELVVRRWVNGAYECALYSSYFQSPSADVETAEDEFVVLLKEMHRRGYLYMTPRPLVDGHHDLYEFGRRGNNSLTFCGLLPK